MNIFFIANSLDSETGKKFQSKNHNMYTNLKTLRWYMNYINIRPAVQFIRPYVRYVPPRLQTDFLEKFSGGVLSMEGGRMGKMFEKILGTRGSIFGRIHSMPCPPNGSLNVSDSCLTITSKNRALYVSYCEYN